MSQLMTQDEWEAKFKPIINKIEPSNVFEGALFETYGAEFEFVKLAAANRVWTLVEVDGKGYISNGLQYVNRMGYFITEVAFEGDFLEVNLGWDADDVCAATIGIKNGSSIAVVAALNNELDILDVDRFEELQLMVHEFVKKHSNRKGSVEVFRRQDVGMYVEENEVESV